MGWMVKSMPQQIYHCERDLVSILRKGVWDPRLVWTSVKILSPPHTTGIRSVDHPPCNCLLYLLSFADSLLMWSFGSNETSSHPPNHLHMLYRLGVLIGYWACKSAVVSRCLMGEIAVMAPHLGTIILLWDQGHLSCESSYTCISLRGFHVTSG